MRAQSKNLSQQRKTRLKLLGKRFEIQPQTVGDFKITDFQIYSFFAILIIVPWQIKMERERELSLIHI